MAKNQELNAEMRELIEPNTLLSMGPSFPSQDRANETPDIALTVPSDVSTLLERMSGLSLAEMDKAIQELQKVTKAAMGSAKAVSENIARFETVAEDFGKSRAA
jgi:hypothetical protein